MMEGMGKLWVTVVPMLMVPICVSGTEFHSTGLGSGPVVELQRLLKAVVSSFMWNWMVEHSVGEECFSNAVYACSLQITSVLF